MKTKFKNILMLSALALLTLTSCEKFLDMQETEEMTFEKIWEVRSTTEKYLTHVYSFIPNESEPQNTTWTGAADETSCSWSTSQYAFSFLNIGAWSASDPKGSRYNNFYRGAREANIFMQNIETCSAPDVTQEEIQSWKNEARFLRAYYYTELMKEYGAVILLKDELIDPSASIESLARPRNSWDECMEWVCGELEAVAKLLPPRYEQSNYYGKPTSVAALSIIARMKLYSARDLFNGNDLYKFLVNADGKRLFPDYRAEKWAEAAAAGRAAIDAIEANGYGLYVVAGKPYESLKGIFYEKWNTEMIWSRYLDMGTWGNHTRPRAFAGGYGGYGPTQQQVDAYAMSNGIYPIVGYEGGTYFLNQRGAGGVTGKPIGGDPTIDPRSGYDETTFSSFANPGLASNNAGAATTNWNMYKNREPRFYAQVSWNNTKYFQAPNTVIQYHNGGNTGNQHHDHPWPGYMTRKMGNQNVNATSPTWGRANWPIIRVAEVYLNYCEALAESGENLPEVLKYMNLIRNRAGVPDLGAGGVYASEINDKAQLRELVRRERRVELSFENHRYWDTRQWMIAESTDNGSMWGMNLRATSSKFELGDDSFWKRTVIQNRVFSKNHYLYPFNQSELDRNKALTQNYAW